MDARVITQISTKITKMYDVDEDTLKDILCKHFKLENSKTNLDFNVRQSFCDGVTLTHVTETFEDAVDAEENKES